MFIMAAVLVAVTILFLVIPLVLESHVHIFQSISEPDCLLSLCGVCGHVSEPQL